jgi:plasmid stabilization system protein ParE
MAHFLVTPTARNHIRKIISDTRDKWGTAQAVQYRRQLEDGLQHIAAHHHTFHSPHREALADGTAFSLHRVQHHYIAFLAHPRKGVIIVGVFHERMDLPTRLRELQNLAQHEIDALKREIGRLSI